MREAGGWTGRIAQLWAARPRMAIRVKVLLVLLFVSLLSSAVVATTLISYFNEDKATYIHDLNADIASSSAASIGLLIEVYGDRLEGLTQTFNASPTPGAALAERFESTEDLIYLGIYDHERRNVLNLCREGAVLDAKADLVTFRAARDRLASAPAYLEVQRLAVRNSSASPALPLFALEIPFHAPAWGKTFYARADFRADHVLSAMRRDPGYAIYVVDRTGAVFAHPDPAVMASEQSFASRRVVRTAIETMGLSSAGTGEFHEPGEEPTLASFAILRQPGLAVLVERPKRDAFLAARALTRKSSTAALIVFLIAAVCSVWIARHATKPLLELSRAAARLERGDFAVRVEPRTHDELGDLARSFNLAARGLEERDGKLKETYEQLYQSEKLVAFGKFSAGIAHEIKNPLTGIIGFSQMLAKKLPDGDPRKHPLQLIEKEAKRCKTILDNLLKFTRKEGFQFEPVRLHAHIRETLELLQPQLGVSQVKAETDLSAPDDLIRGDPNQLRQVLMNLVLNSIDALEGREDRRVTLSTRAAEPGYLDLVVADNGDGIPEDKLRKVFDPFFTTKEPGKGTGLGLSVSYGIVNHHGGRIGVKSRVGEGTEFRITLPVASAEVRQAERLRAEERAKAPVPASSGATPGGAGSDPAIPTAPATPLAASAGGAA